jgi:hypothetical protein
MRKRTPIGAFWKAARRLRSKMPAVTVLMLLRAPECYCQALKLDTGGSIQHSEYGLVMNREWIESRLETPFTCGKP